MNPKNNKFMTKAISLLMALVLWFYVAGTQEVKEPDTISNVPIKVEGLADGYVVSMMSEKTASVKLRSLGLLLTTLKDKDNVLYVDMSGKKSGEYVVPLKMKELAGNLEVEEIAPAQITVEIDKTIKKKMPVQIGSVSTQNGDKAVLPISVSPQEVTIVGPSELVKQAQMATVVIDSDNEEKSSDVSTLVRNVKVYDRNGKEITGLTSIPKKIKVKVSYVPAKSVPIAINTVGVLPVGYSIVSIQVNPARVNIKGTPSDLRKISKLQTIPVDLNGAMVSFTRNVGLMLPHGIYIADGEIPQLSVIISQTSSKRTIDGIKPEIKGGKAGIQYKMEPDTVSIIVTGNPHDVEALNLSDIKAIADVSALTGSQLKLLLDVRVPQGIRVEAMPEVDITATGVQ